MIMSDEAARSLLQPDRSAARSRTVGLLVGSAEDKYENALLRGISDMVRPAGVNLICFTSGALRSLHGFEAQRNVLYDLVNANNVDGLIISGTLAHAVGLADMVVLCRRYQPLPLITVALQLENVPSIMVDSRQGMEAVVEHLVTAHRYRRLAFLSGPRGQQEADERFQAYVAVLTRHKITIDPELVLNGDYTYDSGAAVLQALLDRRSVCFDAIVSANDSMALGALKVLQARGVRVPEEVALTGFDDMEDGRFSLPPLTTVRQSAYLQGREAARLMLSRLQGIEPAANTIMPSMLIVRQSCGCAEQSVALAAVPDLPASPIAHEQDGDRSAATIEALVKAASFLPFDLAVDWSQRLYTAFMAEIEEERSGLFLKTLDDLLRLSQSSDDDGGVWHNVLSELRTLLLPVLNETGQSARAENLWQQGRTLIGERARLRQARWRVQTEQRAAILREISEAMVTSFKLADVLDVIAWELPRLNVTACYLSLFDDPRVSVEQARLILAYDLQGRHSLPRDGERFSSRQLVPPDRLRCVTPYNLVVEALYSKEERLGFVLFEVDAPGSSVCGALRGQLSSALQGVILLEQRRLAEAALQQQQSQLEQLVEARTLALSETNAQLQQEIMERTQAEAALLQSQMISAAMALIARQLLAAADWHDQIQVVLAQLGQASHATHVYVFENHRHGDGELLTSQRYEWVAPGFPPEIDDPRLQNVRVFQPEFEDWYEPLQHGEPFYSSSQDFSEQWADSLKQRGIKTLLDVPIFVNGRWWGIIGFDDCVNELAWSQMEINALRTAADILGAAIQRQWIEGQLRESEERYRLISEVISDYTFSTALDAQGEMRLDWVAGAFEKITGYAYEEYVAHGGWLAALHPDDVEQDTRDMDMLRINRPVITEVRTITKSGEVRWVRVYAHPVWNERENQLAGIYGAVQDITERKQAEAEREALIRELEARNAELERFAYTVSHDLKAPLITIRGFLGFVEQEARAGDWDRLAADMTRIVEATDKMRRLLDELLELSRIGRMMNPSEAVPFAVIVQEALNLAQGRLEASGARIEIQPALPVVHGDRVRLVEVVQNLVDNACKFMGDQAEPKISIGQRGTDRDGKPILFVSDNGLGIDPQYHEQVFGLFNKLDPRSEGTGIGLALVKRIVEVHGGRIWVESEPGQGSTFYFTVPVSYP
jgi:PAS domain S-box-containing protein